VRLIIVEETYYHNILKLIMEVYYNHYHSIETYNYLEVNIEISM